MTSNEIESIRKRLESKRFAGVKRPYSPEEVLKLSGHLKIKHTIAETMSEKLWNSLENEKFIRSLGAMTGTQAVQMVNAGLKAIYVSGWQVAADANLAGETYPDQSIYPSNSVPQLVRRINNAFQREDQIRRMNGNMHSSFVPIIADGEAGFGGPLNVFEMTKWMIESGAAGIHYEDQLSSEKKCGHLGGKVLINIPSAIRNLISARLAADILNVDTVIIARTDALNATLITNDVPSPDSEFITSERTPEGFFRYDGGIEAAIRRGLEFAPYSDLLWFETASPDIDEAKAFSSAIHRIYPEKKLAYNCSPSFNWKQKLSSREISMFQEELADLGYKFQFITLAGFHSVNYSMFKLAHEYNQNGMTAYSELQENEIMDQEAGYNAVKHQAFVGTGYFDNVSRVVSGNLSSTTALDGSTEAEQFRISGKISSEISSH